MHDFTGSVALIGSGNVCADFISALMAKPEINIIGVACINADASEQKQSLPSHIDVTTDFRELLDKQPDIVINATGNDAATSEIFKYKSPQTEVLDGKSAQLILDLLEKQKQSKEESKKLLNESKELYRIGISLLSAEKLEEVLGNLIIEAARTLHAPAGSIGLYDEKSETLKLMASHGFSADFSQITEWKIRDGGITEQILSKRIPTVIPDLEKYQYADNKILLKERIKSLVAVPLFTNENIIGILYLDDFKPREWTRREIEFITLLGIQAAYAIEKFRLIETISNTQTYLKNILDNSPDIIITTDTEGEVVEFNSGASTILGFSKKEVTGKKARDLWAKPDERDSIMGIVNREEYVSNYETQLLTKSGRAIDVSLTLSYIRNDNGNILGTVGISKDITEKKRLERAVEERNLELTELNEKLEEKVIERTRELEKANRELERSNRLKSQFIATVSHELRTPLNSILGFSELLMDEVFGPLEEKQKKYVSNIYNSGTHLLQLINNVLDIAKIESGKMELHYESFSVEQAISEVTTIVKSLIDKKRQHVHINVDKNVSLIKADKVKLKQILYNLLSNAVKFTPEGGDITVEAKLSGDVKFHALGAIPQVAVPSSQLLTIAVIDTGIGIKKEDCDRIFSEFEQADSSFSRRFEGTGLGLALTKKLVELHGGEISVESQEGKGSKFTVVVPLFDLFAFEKPAKPPVALEEDLSLAPTIAKTRRGDAPLILVVEDDPATSEIMTLQLAQGGYRVAHAYNGEEAMKRIRELRPFAVILDVMLPEKDGWEVLQEVKLDPEFKDIPVIMSSVVDNRDLGFALGASDYIVKPVEKVTLLNKLEGLSFATKKGRKPINVLCIDGNEEVLELLTSILEPVGYNVIKAASSKEGIEKAVTYRPDIIILDLMMPDIDGFEVTQAIKSNHLTMDIPIFILTAKSLTVEDRLRLAGKIESFMQKSHFTKEDLLLHIRDLEATYPARAGLLDEVSGLFDHCYFQIRLAQEVSRAARYNNTFTALMLDLDHFTEYIKLQGIHRANICIKKVAEFLRKSLRGSDTVVRFGIDEFAVILSNTPMSSAETVAKRFISYVESYPFYGEEGMPQGKLTASIALTNYPQDASSPEELIFKMRQTLKKAKIEGGNRVKTYVQ